MSTLNLRVGNDTLTHQELDDNFTNLNNDKYESGDSPTFATITSTRINSTIRGKMQALGTINGTNNIDLDSGDIVTCTIDGNTTFTVSNLMAGAVNTVSIYITWSASSIPTITWPSGVAWDRAQNPTLNTSGSTLIMLETYDQGTNWIGVQSWRSYAS